MLIIFSQASYLGLHSEMILRSTYTLPRNKFATLFELEWEG